jgi:hypothetical protein
MDKNLESSASNTPATDATLKAILEARPLVISSENKAPSNNPMILIQNSIENPFLSKNYIAVAKQKHLSSFGREDLAKKYNADFFISMSQQDPLLYKIAGRFYKKYKPKTPDILKKTKQNASSILRNDGLTPEQMDKLKQSKTQGLKPNLFDWMGRKILNKETKRMKQEFYGHQDEGGHPVTLTPTPYPNLFIKIKFSSSRKNYAETDMLNPRPYYYELSKEGEFLKIPSFTSELLLKEFKNSYSGRSTSHGRDYSTSQSDGPIFQSYDSPTIKTQPISHPDYIYVAGQGFTHASKDDFGHYRNSLTGQYHPQNGSNYKKGSNNPYV